MHDTVLAPLRCPHCGFSADEHEWVTEQLGRRGNAYRPGDPVLVVGILGLTAQLAVRAVCPKCGRDVAGLIDVVNGYLGKEVRTS